jgi:putative transposase
VTQDNIVKFAEPGAFEDPLSEVLRNGARKLLADAIEAEVSDFLGRHSRFLTEEGQQRLVRHGQLPEREIMTGIGPAGVRAPWVDDRAGQGEERIRFSSAILPPYARRSKSFEVSIPILYLKCISTGDFEEALAALLGNDAGGLSASTVGRLKDAWVCNEARGKIAPERDRLKKDLALSALQRALVLRQPRAGILHHSDRGRPVLLI